MKNIRRIIVIIIAMILLSIAALPTIMNILGIFNINGSTLWSTLEKMADSAIVKASDTDYNYSGNLYLGYNDGNYDREYIGTEEGIYVYTESAGKVLEYSVNDNDYKECEFIRFGSKILELNKDINTVVVKDQIIGDPLLQSVVVKYQGVYIILHKAIVGWDKGALIRIENNENNINFEYSLDNGNSYISIKNYPWGFETVQIPTIYEDILIIRNKDTKEIVYKSPEIGEIEEEYTYENGKTIVNFSVNGDAKDKTSYYYTINEKQSGNEITVEEDSIVKLDAYAYKEFMEMSTEKEIEVKVINVKEPAIEITDNKLSITAGEVTNDSLGKIYYSLDGENYFEYTDEVELNAGTYTIKAYQVSDEKEIKSEEIGKDVTIEEPNTEEEQNDSKEDKEKTDKNNSEEETNNQEEQSSESNEQGDEISEELENNEENSINEHTESEEESSTDEEKAVSQSKDEINKKENNKGSNTPKTGDNIIVFAIILAGIIILNMIVKYNRKNNNKH